MTTVSEVIVAGMHRTNNEMGESDTIPTAVDGTYPNQRASAHAQTGGLGHFFSIVQDSYLIIARD